MYKKMSMFNKFLHVEGYSDMMAALLNVASL